MDRGNPGFLGHTDQILREDLYWNFIHFSLGEVFLHIPHINKLCVEVAAIESDHDHGIWSLSWVWSHWLVKILYECRCCLHFYVENVASCLEIQIFCSMLDTCIWLNLYHKLVLNIIKFHQETLLVSPFHLSIHTMEIHSLELAARPWRWAIPKGNEKVFQPSMFRSAGANLLLVSGRVFFSSNTPRKSLRCKIRNHMIPKFTKDGINQCEHVRQ